MKKRIFITILTSLYLIKNSLLAETLDKKITLEKAIEIALSNSKKNKISAYDIQIARAQYKQAMSANLPSLDLKVGVQKRDEDLINITKGEFELPQDMSNALALIAAPDSQKTQIQQAIAMGTLPTAKLPMDYTSVVLGDQTVAGELKVTYPLYTGGKISALQKQAKLGKDIAEIKDKRTKQEIIFDIKKYYNGTILAKNLADLLKDTLDRMDALNDLTKSLYEEGSENVKKTDYYRTKIAVLALKTYYSDLNSKVKLAKSALIYAMGIDPKSKISIVDKKEHKILTDDLDTLINKAYQQNTKLIQIDKALKIYDAKIDEANSAYKPNIGLYGKVEKIDNNYDGGMSNSQNDSSWSVGIGAEWNLFNGYKTTNKVNEAKLNKLKMIEQKKLLEHTLALQVKQAYIGLQSSIEQVDILKQTVKTAEDNRDLNTRAYQADMVKTKDVVEAQITEAKIKAKYFQKLYAKVLNKATLDLVIGIED